MLSILTILSRDASMTIPRLSLVLLAGLVAVESAEAHHGYPPIYYSPFYQSAWPGPQSYAPPYFAQFPPVEYRLRYRERGYGPPRVQPRAVSGNSSARSSRPAPRLPQRLGPERSAPVRPAPTRSDLPAPTQKITAPQWVINPYVTPTAAEAIAQQPIRNPYFSVSQREPSHAASSPSPPVAAIPSRGPLRPQR